MEEHKIYNQNNLKLWNILKVFGTKYVFDLFYQDFPRDGKQCYQAIERSLEKIKKSVNRKARLILGEKNKEVDMKNIDLPLAITIFTTVHKNHKHVQALKNITKLRIYLAHDLKEEPTITDEIFEEKFSQLKNDLKQLGASEETIDGEKNKVLGKKEIKDLIDDLDKIREKLKSIEIGDEPVEEMSSKISELSEQNKTLAEKFVKYIEGGKKANIKKKDGVTIIKTDEFLIWPRYTDIGDDKTSNPIQLTNIYIGYQDSLGWVAVKKCPKDKKANTVMEKFCWPFTFPNVLYITKIFTEKNKSSCYLVTELCDKTLKDYIKSGIEEMEKVEMAITLLRAIEYLHTKEIVHRDIKPSNILFANGVLKVADFGISRKISASATYRTSNAGTLDYQAPDLIGKRGNVSVEFKHDVYSVLVIMFYIFTDGQHPFLFDVNGEISDNEIKRRVESLEFHYNTPINKEIEEKLKQLMSRHVASLVKKGEAVTLKEIISFFQEYTKANPNYNTPIMKESTVSYKRYAILLSFTTETEQKKRFLKTEESIKERNFDEATLNVVLRESVAEGALSSPVADVTLMRNALERCKFDVSRLKDDASIENLKTMVEDIKEKNQQQQICIFLHISGHGFHCKENDDTFIKFKDCETMFVSQIISMIITIIGDNNQIIFTIDACRKISSIDQQELDKINLPRNVCILYSCEKGKDTADAGMSASIKSKLCEGANTVPAIFSRAVSNNITCGVSVDYLFKRVKSIMVTEYSCIDTPEKQGHIDFVF